MMNGKTFFGRIGGFLPHLLFTFGIMLLTFYCITLVNEAMCFLSSFVSQKFEVLYVITAWLTVLTAFLQKHIRFVAAVEAVCAAVLLVPVVMCLAQHRMDLTEMHWFRLTALVNAIVSVLFSVLMIVLQRRAARAALRVEQPEAK